MSRTPVAIDELYSLLDAEFRNRRPAGCKSCTTPWPVRRAPADEVSANWFITTPEDCAHGCMAILAEIVAKLMSEYELKRSVFGQRRP